MEDRPTLHPCLQTFGGSPPALEVRLSDEAAREPVALLRPPAPVPPQLQRVERTSIQAVELGGECLYLAPALLRMAARVGADLDEARPRGRDGEQVEAAEQVHALVDRPPRPDPHYLRPRTLDQIALGFEDLLSLP